MNQSSKFQAVPDHQLFFIINHGPGETVSIAQCQLNSQKASKTKNIVYVSKNGLAHIRNSKPHNRSIKCEYEKCGCRTNPFIWVSHSKKIVYFEIPKSASSSIKSILHIQKPNLFFVIHQIVLRELSRGFDSCVIKVEFPAEVNVGEIIQELEYSIARIADFFQFNVNRKLIYRDNVTTPHLLDFFPYYGNIENIRNQYPEYFFFTFVRSPITRAISNWNMFTQKKIRKPIFKDLFKKEAENVTFEEFIFGLSSKHNHHWAPQIDFLPRGKNGVPSIDFIGKLENIEKDWDKLCSLAGLNLHLVQRNQTVKNPLTSNLTFKLKEELRRTYANDFIQFGYEV